MLILNMSTTQIRPASKRSGWQHGIVSLVGGIPTPLTNMEVNWDDDIPNIWENIKVMFQNHHQPDLFRSLKNERNLLIASTSALLRTAVDQHQDHGFEVPPWYFENEEINGLTSGKFYRKS